MIGTVAAIIFLNFALFLISFFLGILAFCKKCPICTCCMKKKQRPKEAFIRDKDKLIEDESEEINATKYEEESPEKQ